MKELKCMTEIFLRRRSRKSIHSSKKTLPLPQFDYTGGYNTSLFFENLVKKQETNYTRLLQLLSEFLSKKIISNLLSRFMQTKLTLKH